VLIPSGFPHSDRVGGVRAKKRVEVSETNKERGEDEKGPEKDGSTDGFGLVFSATQTTGHQSELRKHTTTDISGIRSQFFFDETKDNEMKHGRWGWMIGVPARVRAPAHPQPRSHMNRST